MTKTDVQLPCKYYNSLGFPGNFGTDMDRLWEKKHILLLAAGVAKANLEVVFVSEVESFNQSDKHFIMVP